MIHDDDRARRHRAEQEEAPMGAMTEANIAAWQKASGLEPSPEQELLGKMSDAAFELIKVIELERSGIRDGDGYWHGSDAMGGTAQDLVRIIEEYETAKGEKWKAKHPMPDDIAF
jgi:hypothetical protein